MSSRMVDQAIIERLATEVFGRCRFCHCEGDECKTADPGEKCVLVGPRGMETRCNGFECELRLAAEQAENRRKWKRRVA